MPVTPSITIYFFDIHKKNAMTAIHHLDAMPLDWTDLKLILDFVSEKIYREHNGQRTAHIMVIRHLPGKYKLMTVSSYQRERIRIGQQPLAVARLRFNPINNKVKIDQVNFDTSLWEIGQQYYADKGRLYRSPPLIPKDFFEVSPMSILKEQSGLHTPSYRKEETGPHGNIKATRHYVEPYAIVRKNLYGPRERHIVREDNKF
jgi:hypothetical protein